MRVWSDEQGLVGRSGPHLVPFHFYVPTPCWGRSLGTGFAIFSRPSLARKFVLRYPMYVENALRSPKTQSRPDHAVMKSDRKRVAASSEEVGEIYARFSRHWPRSSTFIASVMPLVGSLLSVIHSG